MDNLEKTTVKNHKMGPKSKLPSKYYEDRMKEIETKRDMDETMFMFGHTLVPDKVDDKLEYNIPDKYEFDRVDNGKIILKPIKSKYPKTYAECKEMLGEDVYYGFTEFMTLQNLIICRNVYWKIAGEQMGLGEPWEPDWCNEDKLKFCIACSYGTIDKTVKVVWNSILAFPTEEMRDAFYENFKDLIEECKELL